MEDIGLKKSLPINNHLIFINGAIGTYVHVDLNMSNEKTEAIISKSNDGLNLQFPVINEPVVDTLPSFTRNLAIDSLTVIKHF